MEITLEGNEEMQKKLDDICKKLLPETIEKGLTKACLLVEGEAKKNCPVDDGTLRASITHDVQDGVGIVGTNVEYAPYVHQGTGIYAKDGHGRQTPWCYQDPKTGEAHFTRGQKPKQFLKDAIDTKQSDILKCFENLLN